MVIRDINPQAPTHVLVIPREHLESLDDASQKDELLLGHLLRISARVAYEHGLESKAADIAPLSTPDAAPANQSSILHIHVLGGREMTWPPG